MRGSRNFCQGGPGQSDKKGSDNVFFFLSLFYRSQMVIFKEIYHFSRFQGGPTFSRGGGGRTFSRGGGGGSNCLFPIETHITCDFPGGSGPPVPPLDPHLLLYTQTQHKLKFSMIRFQYLGHRERVHGSFINQYKLV